jgi:hypothetical protein
VFASSLGISFLDLYYSIFDNSTEMNIIEQLKSDDDGLPTLCSVYTIVARLCYIYDSSI